MTAAAKIRRAFRHKFERATMLRYSQTTAGQHATEAQIRSAGRQLLMNHTAKMRRDGVIAAP